MEVCVEVVGGSVLPACPSSDLGLDGLSRGGVRRGRGQGLDAPGPHVGQELVGDLCQDIFSQPCHAQDVVPCPVNVVSEGDKLGEGGTKMRTWRGKEKREDRKIDKRKIYIY